MFHLDRNLDPPQNKNYVAVVGSQHKKISCSLSERQLKNWRFVVAPEA